MALKHKKKPRLLRVCLLIIISLVIGLNIYLFNASRLVGNSLPMPFGYGAAVVLSGSMEPTLSVNDLVFVQKTSAFCVGDIAVYQDKTTLVVHRIIAVNENMVQTQGDANQAADAPMNKSLVKGKVVGHIPRVGAIVNALKTPTAIVCILAAAILLMELSFRREKGLTEEDEKKIKEEIRQLKQEKENERQR